MRGSFSFLLEGDRCALAGWKTAQTREQTEGWRQAQPQRVHMGLQPKEVHAAATIRRTTKCAAIQLMADNQHSWLWYDSQHNWSKWEVYSYYGLMQRRAEYELDSIYWIQRQATQELQDMLDGWHKEANDAAINKQPPHQTATTDKRQDTRSETTATALPTQHQSEEYSRGKTTVAAGSKQQQNKERQQQSQQQTRQQERQQNHVKKAADMQQQQQRWMQRRHPQSNAHGQQTGQEAPQLLSNRQLLSFLDEAEVASKSMRPFYRDYDEVYLEQMWATLQAAEAKYKTKDARPTGRQIRTILQQKHGCGTTLEANSPRGGDDWAD